MEMFVKGTITKMMSLFFLSYSPLIGLAVHTVSSYLSLFIQSSQVKVNHRLSLMADIVSIGCSVGFVVFCSRVL